MILLIHFHKGWIQLFPNADQVFQEGKNNELCWPGLWPSIPKFLLLDDFTARVDALTEQKIGNNVKQNYPGITLLSVTQKIDAVKDYDQVILMMEGEIIAKGKHDYLLQSCPEYIQIYNSQKSTTALTES